MLLGQKMKSKARKIVKKSTDATRFSVVTTVPANKKILDPSDDQEDEESDDLGSVSPDQRKREHDEDSDTEESCEDEEDQIRKEDDGRVNRKRGSVFMSQHQERTGKKIKITSKAANKSAARQKSIPGIKSSVNGKRFRRT